MFPVEAGNNDFMGDQVIYNPLFSGEGSEDGIAQENMYEATDAISFPYLSSAKVANARENDVYDIPTEGNAGRVFVRVPSKSGSIGSAYGNTSGQFVPNAFYEGSPAALDIWNDDTYGKAMSDSMPDTTGYLDVAATGRRWSASNLGLENSMYRSGIDVSENFGMENDFYVSGSRLQSSGVENTNYFSTPSLQNWVKVYSKSAHGLEHPLQCVRGYGEEIPKGNDK